jgi:outer membrane biosynthesis protein TonB
MPLQAAELMQPTTEAKAEPMPRIPPIKPESVVLPPYPGRALPDRAQGVVGVLFEFGPDGKVQDAFAVNGVTDRWGMTEAALATVRRYELREPPGRTVLACQSFEFMVR